MIFPFFLPGILLYPKSLPYESAFRNAERFQGGKLMGPPKKRFIFGGLLLTPLNLSVFLRAISEGKLFEYNKIPGRKK